LSTFLNYLRIGIAALITITFHEVSHGFIAYKLGDSTAKGLGRLSLNPLKHIDILGLIMLIVAGFGWAKPVPVNMRYFKNPKRGMAITALAGPVSNLILAFVALFFLAALSPFENVIVSYIDNFLFILANISVGLGIFNFIPIPPLDGAKFLFSLFPDNVYSKILQYERFGMVALLIILNTGIMSSFLSNVRSVVIYVLWVLASSPFQWLYGMIF